ncbi:MAG: trypsin-like peptidase domain-containing protein [Gemmatimonadetes bacterium]|nr:trypsin-like peptidase domain-containing protein [Gemmatimonadota bacterium]
MTIGLARANHGILAFAALAAAAPAVAQRPDPVGTERRSVIGAAAARVAPAVVSVNVVRRERTLPRTMFEMFALPRGYEQLVEGLGTGFLVTGDGMVVTNQHVVTGAEQIVVTLRDGRDFPARLLGEDVRTDIAVVKIDTTGLPVAPIGRTTNLRIGDWVVAIGNPYGYLLGNTEPSVTVGVVSGLGRDILPSGDRSGLYVDMIQTDAAINPGNSGGPLVNAAGEVVGVNAFILSQSGGNVGLGFAIPIERALRVARDLRAQGRVRRGWIGVEIAEPPPRSGSWRRQPGVPVRRVATGGPGQRAGLKPGDIIDGVNGQLIRNFLNWEKALLDLGIGDTLRVTVRRGDETQDVAVAAVELPSESATRIAFADLALVTVTPAIQAERRLTNPRGALVLTAGPESQRTLGLQPGDVILQVNNVAITSAEQFNQVIEYYRGRGALRVFFEREGRIGYADFWGGR